MYYWSFWGMHAFWWLFWVAMIAIFFVALTPVRRSRARLWDDPLSILRRRYARGELSTEEYEERKGVLAREADPRVVNRTVQKNASAGQVQSDARRA
jgi:putative membrane protein